MSSEFIKKAEKYDSIASVLTPIAAFSILVSMAACVTCPLSGSTTHRDVLLIERGEYVGKSVSAETTYPEFIGYVIAIPFVIAVVSLIAAAILESRSNALKRHHQECLKSQYWGDPDRAPSPGVKDPLFWDAVRSVIAAGRTTTSQLRRDLRIGHGRAEDLLTAMLSKGYVGPPDEKSHKRPVLPKAHEDLKKMEEKGDRE